jgi:probable rRNA maturation factor
MTAAAVQRIDLTFANRQRTRPVHLPALRPIVKTLLRDLLEMETAELGISLVAALEMTRLNEDFLHHAGCTDVITFDYAHHASRITHHAAAVHGEIFVCIDEAILQARRFRTTWQSELVRYIVHGVLHLMGHDDHRSADRRKMKREENRLVRLLASRFPLSRLGRKPRLPA